MLSIADCARTVWAKGLFDGQTVLHSGVSVLQRLPDQGIMRSTVLRRPGK
jgi:hypothetical protein